MASAETAGDRMRALRERLGLSIRRAAQRAGVSHGTIQNIEAAGLDGRSFDIVERVARGYGVGLDDLQRIARGLEPTPLAPFDPESYQVHPGWVVLPVHRITGASDDTWASRRHEPAYVLREHLARRGASIGTTRAYVVDGRFLVGPEALRVERAFEPGDLLAVDGAMRHVAGDVVACWWARRRTLVIHRHGLDRADAVLTPVGPGRMSEGLPAEDDLEVLGPLVWRGG